MKTTTIIAAILAFSTPAVAQEPPTTLRLSAESDASSVPSTRVGSFEVAGDTDTYRIYLEQGKDYAVGAISESAKWTLTGPTGTVLYNDGANLDHDWGHGFRAGRTGYFTITGIKNDFETETYPSPYKLRVFHDCHATIKTRCILKAGQTINRGFGFGFDKDTFQLRNLAAGRRYTLSGEWHSRSVSLEILDGTGKVVALQPGGDPITFRASTSTRFVRVAVGDGFGWGGYQLTLTQ
jgi:hypothetical protein